MKYRRSLALLAIGLYLGLSGRHLAIYTDTDLQPLQVLPYDVSLFTKADAKQLHTGIPFSTAAELSQLLEDYTS